MGADQKPTNPKDVIGSGKLPLELVPDTLTAYAALAFFEGASKYGRFNWRVAGVRASIYRAALQRHLAAWWNGEDCDPNSGVPHLASVAACVGILIDSEACDMLTDDRPPAAPLAALHAELAQLMPEIRDRYFDPAQTQYTIADTPGR